MNDDLIECYNLLGLNPGASSEELKAAHRDLTKVWHPDRFLHDPRLQEKAQQKLKEINEAYDQLRSGKAKRHTQPPASTRVAQRVRWQLVLGPVLIFAAAFLVTSRSLLRPGEREDQSQIPAIEQTQDPPSPERQQPGSRVNTYSELPPGKDRIEAKSQSEESGGASTSQASATPLRALPTVTTVIDPTTGMIARRNCPMKTRMTYPSGNEPHQYCSAHPAAPVDTSSPKESRLKSVAKRVASPGKWFGGKTKSDAGTRQDAKSP